VRLSLQEPNPRLAVAINHGKAKIVFSKYAYKSGEGRRRRTISRPVVAFFFGLIAMTSALLGSLNLTCAATQDVKIQLCMVIDGSGSINSADWSIIVNAVSKGVNETISHDGSVEFSIVQFGTAGSMRARTELPPTIIDDTTYIAVAGRVLAISKIGGETPMADGLYLAWKELRNSSNYQNVARQVINLATDGIPNIHNNNATSDLDGNGHVDAYDDVIAVVNDETTQGLDELDMEGIGNHFSDVNATWFRDNIVRPKPGISAPPFTKPGWIRKVSDANEFANTLGEKFKAIIGEGEQIWAPSPVGAFFASVITAGFASIVSSLASAVTNPESFPSQIVAQKISATLPETLKKWLQEFISAKRKLVIGSRAARVFTLTKLEAISYAVSLSFLTFAYSYVRVSDLSQIWILIPTVLATSIVVEFCKNFLISIVARVEGVWTEHRLWYFGLGTFLFSVLVFKVPFSSPARLTHNAPKFTKRSLGLVAAAQVAVALVLAAVFFSVFTMGWTVIGNIGLVMCLTMAFFDSIPIPPMNGHDVYDWSKILWLVLFITALTLYVLCVFVL